jgi:hypothetical protein
MKYLAAVTALGSQYPAYINFSRDEETGDVRIAGRQESQPDGNEGQPFELRLPSVCVELMFEEGLRNLRSPAG